MAQKRMFDKRVVESDKFTDLPNSSKALYFMAGMSADDKGFFQPRRLQKMCGFTDDDFKILIAKGYFILFESGVMVVTDWNKNNWLDSRRITETEYVEELKLLKLINEKYELVDSCLANAKPMLRENRIEENSIEYIKENNKKKSYGKFKRIKLTDKEYKNLIEEFGKEFIDNQIELLDDYVETNDNKNGYKNYNLVLRKSIRENWFKKKEQNIPTWFKENNDLKEANENEKKEFDNILKEIGG